MRNPSQPPRKILIARFSEDLKIRAIVLHYIYSMSQTTVCKILGCSPRSIRRWYLCFKETGSTDPETAPTEKKVRWSSELLAHVTKYIKDFPMFYIEELQDEIKAKFPQEPHSAATVSRALRFNLGLSRKIMERRARESSRQERQIFFTKLAVIYSYPEQLMFLDETSKDGRSCWRRYGWSRRGEKCFTTLPYTRGKRVSILAALDCTGFIAYDHTEDTFTRRKFHDSFVKHILPLVQPWPLPRSIVILDNARIHMYPELERCIEERGGMLLFLPPYSPDLNPIEPGFGLLKAWIQKYANLVWPKFPVHTLPLLMLMSVQY